MTIKTTRRYQLSEYGDDFTDDRDDDGGEDGGRDDDPDPDDFGDLPFNERDGCEPTEDPELDDIPDSMEDLEGIEREYGDDELPIDDEPLSDNPEDLDLREVPEDFEDLDDIDPSDLPLTEDEIPEEDRFDDLDRDFTDDELLDALDDLMENYDDLERETNTAQEAQAQEAWERENEGLNNEGEEGEVDRDIPPEWEDPQNDPQQDLNEERTVNRSTRKSKTEYLKECKDHAKSKGGECLSKDYINTSSKLSWKCDKGHAWKANRLSVIKHGTWCPECFGKKKLTIEEMQDLGVERGGKCLSKEIKNRDDKLEWECERGHRWKASGHSVKNSKSWCPYCSGKLSERITRKYFEHIFSKKFPKKWPNWLRNDRGNKMELDGYNEELKIAFERNGKQHYKFIPHFQKKVENFKRQKKDDLRKKKLCKERDITLIEVPYTIDYEDMQDYIAKACKKRGIKVPENVPEIDYKDLNAFSPEKLKDFRDFVESKGGKLLTKNFLGDKKKHKLQCDKGHQWWSTPNNTKSGKWCPKCYEESIGDNRRKYNIDYMQNYAKSRGGKCHSTDYKNLKDIMDWECKYGHRWSSKAHYAIYNKSWCPKCAKGCIEEMQDIAQSRGGFCRSKEHKGATTKLEFECAEGHVWWTEPNNVKNRGTWCPICARKNRKKK